MKCVSILLNPQRKSHWFPTKIMIFQNFCWELSIVPHFLRRQKKTQISGTQPDPLPARHPSSTLFRPLGPRSWQQRHRILEVPIPELWTWQTQVMSPVEGHQTLQFLGYFAISTVSLFRFVHSQQLQLVSPLESLIVNISHQKRWRVFRSTKKCGKSLPLWILQSLFFYSQHWGLDRLVPR